MRKRLLFVVASLVFAHVLSAQTLAGIPLIDTLATAVHPDGCDASHILGYPNDSTWVNFDNGDVMTGTFGSAHLVSTGRDLLLETSFNRDNYAVCLLLSTGLYSDTHYVDSQHWTLLPSVLWAYASTNCNTSYSNSFHWMLLLDFNGHFGLSPSDVVTGISITFLPTSGVPDLAGVYIVEDTICGPPEFTEFYNPTICAGDTFTVHGTHFYQEGFSTQSVLNQFGCDSIRFHVSLEVNDVFTASYSPSICFGESYQIHGVDYSQEGIYADTVVGLDGCDSLHYTVNLEVVGDTVIFENYSPRICEGGFFDIHGLSYTQAGIYQDTILNSLGCDSIIVQVNLELDTSQTLFYTSDLCVGDTLEIYGFDYYQTGVYHDTLFNQQGCDSIRVSVNLTVNNVLNESYSPTLCFGDSFEIHGFSFSQEGVYTDTIIGASGCDSIRFIVDVSAVSDVPISESYDLSICDGDSFTMHGFAYSQAGFYQDTLMNQAGCDSIYFTVDLSVSTVIVESYTEEICEGETVQIHGINYIQAGLYFDTLVASSGCDSIRYSLNLQVNTVDSIYLDTLICVGQSLQLGSQTLDTTGLYSALLTTVEGCDSIVTVHLTVDTPRLADLPIDTTICRGDTVQFDASTEGASAYSWSNGESTAAISVDQAGQYVLAVSFASACELYDTISLITVDCNEQCPLLFPSGFSPNGNGINEQFILLNPCQLSFETFELKVYNRWGELVFFGKEANQGWSGIIHTKPAPLGVYTYQLRYRIAGATSEERLAGNVTLVR